MTFSLLLVQLHAELQAQIEEQYFGIGVSTDMVAGLFQQTGDCRYVVAVHEFGKLVSELTFLISEQASFDWHSHIAHKTLPEQLRSMGKEVLLRFPARFGNLFDPKRYFGGFAPVQKCRSRPLDERFREFFFRFGIILQGFYEVAFCICCHDCGFFRSDVLFLDEVMLNRGVLNRKHLHQLRSRQYGRQYGFGVFGNQEKQSTIVGFLKYL